MCLLAVVLSASSCRQAVEAEVVEWPELGALDLPSARAEGLSKKKQVDALRALLPELAALAGAVTEATVPRHARHPEPTRVLLADLADLAAQAGKAGQLPDEDVLVIGGAFHPLVARLMEESGMPHLHKGEGPNGGWLHPLGSGSDVVGQVEIKLHDDAGDLEVWFTKGQDGAEPLDLPLDTVVRLEFPDRDSRAVELRVRNAGRNEDEDGASTVRSGLTNYFVFPGESDADASWLMGKDFAAKVTLAVSADGLVYEAGPLELKPHVH